MKKFKNSRFYIQNSYSRFKIQDSRFCFQKGQSLLEIVITTAIIVTVITAILGLVTQSLVASGSSKLKTQAAFLAQEAMEIVHNIRDTNWKKGTTPWYTNFHNGTNNGWYKPNAYNSTTGWSLLYISTGETDATENFNLDGTDFKRAIYVEDMGTMVTTDDKRKVTVKVIWVERGSTNKVETSTILTNWGK